MNSMAFIRGLLVSMLVPALLHGADGGVLPAETRISANLDKSIDTKTSKNGDQVSAVLGQPVKNDGRTVLPVGSRLTGHVESVQAAEGQRPGWVRLVFNQLALPDGQKFQIQLANTFSANSP